MTSEPVTVVLSERGWVARGEGSRDRRGRARRIAPATSFLPRRAGKSNQLAVFIDSTGRAYSVGAHTLPSARGQGEPLSGYFNPPDGASFRAVLIGAPEERWVVASSAGYGFVVKLEELHSRNKAGKAALRVPAGSYGRARVAGRRAAAARLAAASSDGRLLVFPLAELPELRAARATRSSPCRGRTAWCSRPSACSAPSSRCGSTRGSVT